MIDSVEEEGLRMALEEAKEESDRQIKALEEELRVARSDLLTMKELVIRLSMKAVGM